MNSAAHRTLSPQINNDLLLVFEDAVEPHNQLKQLVDERHCSLAEAKKKLDAKDSATPTITRSVEDEDSGWEAVSDDFIDNWIDLKYEEVQQLRQRPHPHEFTMYYDA